MHAFLIIRRHHHQREAQECGQSQLSRSREENGLLKHAAGRTLLSLSYTQEADPAFEHLRVTLHYFKDSRKMKKLKDPHLRVQLLKHTKRVIVHTLCVLPKTQHDFSSFVVDTWFQTETMLCFSVSGVFKEVEGSSQGCVRAFTRTFIATPASYSSLCIVNDELFVSDSNPKKTEFVFFIPKPTSCASSIPTLSMERQEMVQALSTWSGMNLQDSQK
ncbi:nuclear RNA export factor 2-like [Eubalaena glacialis]|uniref:nuclear RNA export factor 2-like n=1 Tax=Eubalaena glacialis TaxID=27606 RepID=UPI002A5AB751|nr:nuclear RNA export factor 2-like [Eubalaena glacialis]